MPELLKPKYIEDDGLAVVLFLQQNGFKKAELIGGIAKRGYSEHDIDIYIPGAENEREKLKEILLESGFVDDTDWGGMFFHNTRFGDVDIFFSIEDFDY